MAALPSSHHGKDLRFFKCGFTKAGIMDVVNQAAHLIGRG